MDGLPDVAAAARRSSTILRRAARAATRPRSRRRALDAHAAALSRWTTSTCGRSRTARAGARRHRRAHRDNAAVWRELFANHAHDTRPLSRVFVTHMHPDHVGLCRLADAQVRRAPVDDAARVPELPRDGVRHRPRGAADAIEFYRRAGWSAGTIRRYRARFGNFGKHIHTLPTATAGCTTARNSRSARTAGRDRRQRPLARARLPALRRTRRADLRRPGPAAHLVQRLGLPDRARRQPDAAVARLGHAQAREVPADVLVLPSHNEPFRGLHDRVDALAPASSRRWRACCAAWPKTWRAVDVFNALFARTVGEDNVPLLGMATGEAIVCLNYLLERGRWCARRMGRGRIGIGRARGKRARLRAGARRQNGGSGRNDGLRPNSDGPRRLGHRSRSSHDTFSHNTEPRSRRCSTRCANS